MAKILAALVDINRNPELKTLIFPALHEANSGDDLPLEIIGHFDGELPDHGFFKDDKMDVCSKSFLSGALYAGEDSDVVLDISYYGEQIRQINHDLEKSQAVVDAFVRDLKK